MPSGTSDKLYVAHPQLVCFVVNHAHESSCPHVWPCESRQNAEEALVRALKRKNVDYFVNEGGTPSSLPRAVPTGHSTW